MSRVYDNWEKLVEATLDREKLRQLAFADSRESSFRSSVSSSSSSQFDFDSALNITTGQRRDISVPIHLTYEVVKAVDAAAALFKKECVELKHKTQQLELLLQQAAFATDILYDCPTRRIMDDTHEVLQKALVLVKKCRGSLRQRLFTIIPVAAFRTISSHLENSIRNVSWLLCDDKYLGVPPIAAGQPILCHIWELISSLHTGSADFQCNAAASLVSLARDDEFNRKMIRKEGGIGPLLRLLKEGTIKGQDNAAIALGLLGEDSESLLQMREARIPYLFCRILKEVPMDVHPAVPWGIYEITGCLFDFNLPNIDSEKVKAVKLLVSHLAFIGVQSNEKELIYTMAARALWNLIKLGDDTFCREIVKSNALSHLAILLDKGPKESRYVFIMALMEIAKYAEGYDLFRSYFKPNLLVRKAIVDLLVVTHEMEDSELLLPCINIVGNLAQSFGAATEIRMISPLVKLLQKSDVCEEACITLVKFVSNEKFSSLVYGEEIIIANGVKYIVQLVLHSEDEIVQIKALILLCYVVQCVPESKELVDAEVFNVFSWALKHEPFKKNKDVKRLLPLAARKVGITFPEDLTFDFFIKKILM